MDSRTVIKCPRKDGWRLKDTRGSHHQFEHPTKPGKVTVAHPVRVIPPGTLRKIEKQSGVDLSRKR